MNGLEERLRSELHAESEQITPGSLTTLRLPDPRQRGRSWRSRMRPGCSRRWPGWAVPLAAAATVAVLIIGTAALVRTAAVSPAGPPVASHIPAYYAYGVPAAHPHRTAPGTGGEPPGGRRDTGYLSRRLRSRPAGRIHQPSSRRRWSSMPK